MTENEPKSSQDIHFLIVDDDGESRRMIAEYLEAMGHTKISQAKDGLEAYKLIERDPTIGFIISDWDMPLMTGFSLLQKLRAHPSKAHLPFLIVTSPVSQESEKIILAAENLVDSYLIKPFRSDVLKEKIGQILETSVHGPQKTVVVVDDDEDAREMIIEYLKKMGFNDVRGLSDGLSGLSFLQEHAAQVGLIISDWEMPKMSGLQLLQACKKNLALTEVPFLMITSQSSIERIKVMQAAQAHVDQYLLKPFDSSEIRKKVDYLLQRSHLRREVRQQTSEGQRFQEHSQFQRARECFEAAVKLDPEYDVALRNLGDVLIKIKGVESALPYYKRAVEANGLNPRNYLRLSAAYEAIGWLDKAVALLQGAVMQVAFSADLHFHLGRLYNKKDLVPLAKKEFEKTLELQLDHKEARLMLEMINQRQGNQRGG